MLGRVDGVELDLQSPDGEQLTVFTPHADALAQARFVLMSPRHPEADELGAGADVREQLEQLRSGGWERGAREAETIPVIDTGRVLRRPDGTSAAGARLARSSTRASGRPSCSASPRATAPTR